MSKNVFEIITRIIYHEEFISYSEAGWEVVKVLDNKQIIVSKKILKEEDYE